MHMALHRNGPRGDKGGGGAGGGVGGKGERERFGGTMPGACLFLDRDTQRDRHATGVRWTQRDRPRDGEQRERQTDERRALRAHVRCKRLTNTFTLLYMHAEGEQRRKRQTTTDWLTDRDRQ